MEAINLRELAIAHRHANWGVIAGLVGAITHWYAAFAVIPYLLYGAWKHGKAAHFGVSARLGVSALMLLPVANVFALALVSHRASRELKRAGLRVGPMGVKANDLPPGSNTMPKAHSASSTTDRGFSMRSFALAGGVLTDQMQDKALVFAMSILLGGAGMLLGCTESEDGNAIFVAEFGEEHIASVEDVKGRSSDGLDYLEVVLRFRARDFAVRDRLDAAIRKRYPVTVSCGDFYASLEKPAWWTPAPERWDIYRGNDSSIALADCTGLIVSKDGYIYYYRGWVQ